MNSIQFNYANGKFEYMGRCDGFSAETKKMFQSCKNQGTAICHRVSYKLMAQGLINSLNYFLYMCGNLSDENSENVEDESYVECAADITIFYIIGVIVAVTGQNYEEFIDLLKVMEGIKESLSEEEEANELDIFFNYDFDDFFYNVEFEDYNENLNHIKNTLMKVAEGYDSLVLMLAVEGLINRILSKLNNEKINLTVGNAAWNSSLGDAFDAFGKIEKDDAGYHISEEDSMVLTILIHGTKPGGAQFVDSGLFMYTAKYNDEKIIYQSHIDEVFKRECEVEECEDPIWFWDYVKEEPARL